MTRLPPLKAALLLYERGAVTVDVNMMRAVESIISARAGSRRSGARRRRGNLDMASEKNNPKNDYMNSHRNVSAAKVAPR